MLTIKEMKKEVKTFKKWLWFDKHATELLQKYQNGDVQLPDVVEEAMKSDSHTDKERSMKLKFELLKQEDNPKARKIFRKYDGEWLLGGRSDPEWKDCKKKLHVYKLLLKEKAELENTGWRFHL